MRLLFRFSGVSMDTCDLLPLYSDLIEPALQFTTLRFREELNDELK
jgi:hypothetical protein